ncbi:hypothetical protein [Streptomyces sp. NPDC046925]|uniref:hypothetical protein n=1 Tax=Streptomyces sp. NPDC046925 TaxID=3155375 RepID=UPI0033C5105F
MSAPEKPKRITVWLSSGKVAQAFAYPGPCYDAGACVCGVHKGEGQCEFGDCHNERSTGGGNLCDDCASRPWKVALPGLHGPNAQVDEPAPLAPEDASAPVDEATMLREAEAAYTKWHIRQFGCTPPHEV